MVWFGLWLMIRMEEGENEGIYREGNENILEVLLRII